MLEGIDRGRIDCFQWQIVPPGENTYHTIRALDKCQYNFWIELMGL